MNEENSTAANADHMLQEAEALIWALLDDRLEAADSTRLCQLIENNEAVRSRYIDCIQLHADLRDFYAHPGDSSESKPAASPVLSNLGFGDLPGAGSLPTLHD
jgi:anti-sigma factor RsiW